MQLATDRAAPVPGFAPLWRGPAAPKDLPGGDGRGCLDDRGSEGVPVGAPGWISRVS